VPDMLEMSLARLDVDNLGGIPLLGLRENPLQGPNLWLKRGTDILVAGLGMVVLAIPMLIMAVAIKLRQSGTGDRAPDPHWQGWTPLPVLQVPLHGAECRCPVGAGASTE